MYLEIYNTTFSFHFTEPVQVRYGPSIGEGGVLCSLFRAKYFYGPCALSVS